ncbi:MAG TPA: alpha-amylase family protein [Micromonosporaceae bacterium]
MRPPWWRNACIYAIDVATFCDTNGDGWGDLAGVRSRLDYVAGLGANCVWLLPFYRTPYRDNGYDVSDYLSVDPRFGDLADFAELMAEADDLGIRVLVDLVVQHTSDRHPWFRQAVEDARSPYRDFYIWADTPDDTSVSPIFPGEEDSVWTLDERSGQYYRHVFYHHEPDLDHSNPKVRREIERVMEFWLRLGVAGFRVDAVPYMVEQAENGGDGSTDHYINDLSRLVRRHRSDGVLLAETDLAPKEYASYFGGPDGDGFHMQFNFYLNQYIFLSLARQSREPILRALDELPEVPIDTQYVNWLRNHDELDLGRLTDAERAEVNRAFAPDRSMLLYGRGPRRRLAPLLDGDERRVQLAYSVLMSLPGAPMVRYGDEIGMGDDMSLPDRLSVRAPMQWSPERNAGFSGAAADRLVRPVISDGPFGFERVNVLRQQTETGSLLDRVSGMVRTRRGLRQIGNGRRRALDLGRDSVLAFLYSDPGGGEQILMINNLADEEAVVSLPDGLLRGGGVDLFADAAYEKPAPGRASIRLNPYGYRWLRPLI